MVTFCNLSPWYNIYAFLPPSSSPTLLEPHWSPCHSSSKLNILPYSALCPCASALRRNFPTHTGKSDFLTLFMFLFMYHFVKQISPNKNYLLPDSTIFYSWKIDLPQMSSQLVVFFSPVYYWSIKMWMSDLWKSKYWWWDRRASNF